MNDRRSLQNTTTFEFFSDIKLDKRIFSNLEKSLEVEKEDIEDALKNIKKYNLPGTSNIVNSFLHGDYKVIYSRALKEQIPTMMSAFHVGDMAPIVDITHIAKLLEDETLEIKNERKLYAALMSGYIKWVSFTQWDKISKNKSIRIYGAELYSKIMGKAIRRLFSVNNKLEQIKLRYLLSRFYLQYMLNLKPEISHDLAMESMPKTNKAAIKVMNKTISSNIYGNFKDFIEGVKNNIPVLAGLNLKDLYETVIKTYGVSTPFMVDNFDYLAIQVGYASCGSYMNNQYAFEDLLDEVGTEFFVELMRAV